MKRKTGHNLFDRRCEDCETFLERTPSGFLACPHGHGKLVADVRGLVTRMQKLEPLAAPPMLVTRIVNATTRMAGFKEIVRWLVMNCFPTLGFLLSASATSLSLLAPYRPSPTSPSSFLRVRSRATRPH